MNAKHTLSLCSFIFFGFIWILFFILNCWGITRRSFLIFGFQIPIGSRSITVNSFWFFCFTVKLKYGYKMNESWESKANEYVYEIYKKKLPPKIETNII